MKQNSFRRWSAYLFLELKKALRLIPAFLMIMAVTAAGIAAAAILFTAVMSGQQVLPKARVSIVTIKVREDGSWADDSMNLLTRLGSSTVAGMAAVETIADISYCSIDEAEAALADGTLDAAIYVTADVYQDINSGVNTPITVRLGKKAASLEGSLFSSLVRSGVRLVRTVEAAVYTPYALADSYELRDTAEALGNRIFDIYMGLVLSRGSFFGQESVSAFGSLTIPQFYAASGLVLILLLFGIGFTAFYTASEKQVRILLRRSGIPRGALDAARILSISLVLALFGFLMTLGLRTAFAAAAAAAQGGVPLPVVLAGSLAESLGPSAAALPGIAAAAVLTASLIHLPGQYLGSASFGMVYTLLVLVLFIISGGLLPNAWLPGFLRSLAAWSPVALCQRLAVCSLFPEAPGTGSLLSLLPAALGEAAVLLLAAYAGGLLHERRL